jgi:putative ABC transport system permease protein
MLPHYVKLALKVLRRRKFFTFISLFAISFTLMVLVVVSALLDHMLAAGSPELNLDRTLHLSFVELKGENATANGEAGWDLLNGWLRDLPGVERFAIASRPRPVVGFVDGEKVVSRLIRADGEYWNVLRFRFLEGGPFGPADDRDGNRVAVINAATRRRWFGDQPAVGRGLEVDGQSFRVVGVVENAAASRLTAAGDVWVPIGSLRSRTDQAEYTGNYIGLFLARQRRDFPGIRAEAAARLARVPLEGTEFDTVQGPLQTRYEELVRAALWSGVRPAPTRRATLLLGAAALLFMLLPTINLVNINISRILERASEIGVRKSFGASSAHLVGQFLVENVVLCLVGGAVGLAAAAGVLALIGRSGLVPHAEFQVHARIVLYTLGLTLFFGGLSGVYPAWRMSRLHPVQALNGAVR